MVDPDVPLPVRWITFLLGWLLALSSLVLGTGLLLEVSAGYLRITSGPPVALLLALVAMGWTLVMAVHLLARGVGGGTRRVAPVFRSLRWSLVASGLATSLLPVQVLFAGLADRLTAPVVAVLVGFSAVCFVLAWIAHRAVRRAEDSPGRRAAILSAGAVPLVAVLVAVALLLEPMQRPHPSSPYRDAVNNARNLSIILSERSARRGWPPYGGKNFVLALVAHELIDIRNPDNLEIFFCPPRGEQAVVPSREAYEAVTKDALTQRRFPTLTDFAGRRNDEPAYRLVQGDHEKGEPILGCRYGDGVVIGFSDGAAHFVDREDLGLGPDEEIGVGEASTSPLLRPLSDR